MNQKNWMNEIVTTKDLQRKDGQRQLLCYVSLIRACIVVLLFWLGDICGKCICKLPKLETWISNLIY